jgi:hypothetical protein
MTESERLVNKLCEKVFLSLWTIASPIGKEAGKELCDALVVFDNSIIIISVKDIKYKETEKIEIGWDRWNKTAIDKSIKQLKGAKRFLDDNNEVKSQDGKVTIQLPEKNIRIYFLLTISLGSQREVPVILPENEIVHFLDEYNLDTLFSELDTVADFIEYLQKKEDLLKKNKKITGSEEDILAFYLHQNRSFPENGDLLFFGDDLWKEVSNKEEYKIKKELDKISIFWDSLIEEFINLRDPSIVKIPGYFDPTNENIEFALRTLAKENRFSRRVLSQEFFDFHDHPEIVSRIVESINGIIYVFLKAPISVERRDRIAELSLRCYIAKSKMLDKNIFIGIATEDDISKGHSSDLVYFNFTKWTDDDSRKTEKMSRDLGFFSSPRISRFITDEYPIKASVL